ncbi:MAG: CinA family nicotinamide mononucleotide deamidase-related protein [Fusobacteria bacterium]|nr:CinA family nicotinamide mononucleotide deamidase-related protein [Fusobacteriota bacterium]
MKVGIILVGTELLNGDIVDTNSQFIQNYLLEYGMDCTLKVVVKDHIESIIAAIEFVENKVDLLIMSGGLGPTFDDITRDAISKFYGAALEIDAKSYEKMKGYFDSRATAMPENNMRQVTLPKGCEVVENQVGVAPGFYIGKILALQGVPRELEDGLKRFISTKYSKSNPKFKKDILLYGVAESVVEDSMIDIIKRYERELEFEILARPYGIILRTIYSQRQESIAHGVVEKIKSRVQEWYYGEDSDRLESKLVKILREKGLKISLAESCTGGLIAAALTSVSGVSEVFQEGLVTYSNDSKQSRLGVSEGTLEKFGAVSEECIKEMLRGLKTPIKIAVSGIAGPMGGSVDKPVGLVIIGVEVEGKQVIIKHHFGGEREMIQERAKNCAMFQLLKWIAKN